MTKSLSDAVWPDGIIICSIFSHEQQLKFAHWHCKIANNNAKYYKPLKSFQRLLNFWHSGGISPNPVTLITCQKNLVGNKIRLAAWSTYHSSFLLLP